MKVKKEFFGTVSDGRETYLYSLSGKGSGDSNDVPAASFTDYGAAWVSCRMPAAVYGPLQDMVLGYNSVDGYEHNSGSIGCFVGRNANRIADARVTIGGKEYQLEVNNGPNNLHSGSNRLALRMMDAELFLGDHLCTEENQSDEDGSRKNAEFEENVPYVRVRFSGVSEDMSQDFPGNLKFAVTYTLTDNNEVILDYEAVSDKDTLINFTNHSYFNLSGNAPLTEEAAERYGIDPSWNGIKDHRLYMPMTEYTPVNENLIPTGELAPAAGTPLDFTKEKPIGQSFDKEDPYLKAAGGYDHNYVVERPDGTGVPYCDDAPSVPFLSMFGSGDEGETCNSGLIEEAPALRLAARVWSPRTLSVMEVLTDRPGLQIYTGNNIRPKRPGREGTFFQDNDGVCFETQAYPNACNEPAFASTIWPAGKVWRSRTVYRFCVKEV